MQQWTYPDLLLRDINDFSQKFIPELRNLFPSELPVDQQEFRINFMQEELDEYAKACKEKDLEGQFDALIDLVYVALGTAWMQGFPFSAGWAEVQRANMSKERATADPNKQTKRKSTIDVFKPEGWKGPDIKRVLDEHFLEVQQEQLR